MTRPPLSGSRNAARSVAASEASRLAADEAIRAAAKADAFVQSFVAMTPAQVLDYVNANVTTVAGARALLGKMAVMLLLLARSEYRED